MFEKSEDPDADFIAYTDKIRETTLLAIEQMKEAQKKAQLEANKDSS